MTHYRQEVLDLAFKSLSALIDSHEIKDLSFERFENPSTDEDFPQVRLMIMSDRGQRIQDGAPRFSVSVDLGIWFAINFNDSFVQDLNALSEKIESALLSNPDFINNFEFVESFENEIDINTLGETILASCMLVYTLVFNQTYPPKLSNILSDIVPAPEE